jgi:hypothetical protein
MMREIVPLNIYKTNLVQLSEHEGLPEITAQRIWNIKILWLIVTHPDDIQKVN